MNMSLSLETDVRTDLLTTNLKVVQPNYIDDEIFVKLDY